MKNVYCIGNILLEDDNIPLRLIKVLQKEIQEFCFLEADPNENFIPEDGSIILDTVANIDDVQIFTSLDNFSSAPRVSVHDYDLAFHLRFLKKIGKLSHITIVGIPQNMKEDTARRLVIKALQSLN